MSVGADSGHPSTSVLQSVQSVGTGLGSIDDELLANLNDYAPLLMIQSRDCHRMLSASSRSPLSPCLWVSR